MLNGSMCFHLETHIWITAFHFDPFIQDVSDSSEILHGDVQVTLIHHRIPSLVHSCGLHASQDFLKKPLPCSRHRDRQKSLAMTPCAVTVLKRRLLELYKACPTEHTKSCNSWSVPHPASLDSAPDSLDCWTKLDGPEWMSEWMLNVKKHQGHPLLSFQQHGDKPWVCHLRCDFQIFWFCISIKEVVFRHDKNLDKRISMDISIVYGIRYLYHDNRFKKMTEKTGEPARTWHNSNVSCYLPRDSPHRFGLVFRLCRSAQTRPFGGPWCWGRCNPAWLYPQPGPHKKRNRTWCRITPILGWSPKRLIHQH